MRKHLAVAVLLAISLSPSAFAQFVAELPIGGGPITIRNYEDEDWLLHSLGFISDSGNLIPAPLVSFTRPDGESTLVGDPGSFTFMISNTPNQVTYANLGSNVTFAADSCTVLTSGVRPNSADVFGSFGGGATPVDIRVDLVDSVCAVPEPRGIYLVAVGLLGLVATPRSKRIGLHD